jgi:hypothetical protein
MLCVSEVAVQAHPELTHKLSNLMITELVLA